MIKWDEKERLKLDITFINRSRIYLYPLWKKQYKIKNDFPVACAAGIKDCNCFVAIYNKPISHKGYFQEVIIDEVHTGYLFNLDVNFDSFVKGEWSKLLKNPEDVDCYKNQMVKHILTKDKKAEANLLSTIKSSFSLEETNYLGNNIDKEIISSYQEYDLPPNLNKEVLLWN